MRPYPVVITCEHAGNTIPPAFQHHFTTAKEVLSTHRGWDMGALSIAQYLAQDLQVPLFFEKTSRLLIEMNRSLDHPALFSEYTQALAKADRLQLIEELYLPYRQQVISSLKSIIDNHQAVLHLSIHTFTPVLGHEVRKTGIGLLFDPERSPEVIFCKSLRQSLRQSLSWMQIDFNSPYQGIDDGFTTFLRKEFSANQYCGIEIEVNQKYAEDDDVLLEINKHLSQGIRNFYEGK